MEPATAPEAQNETIQYCCQLKVSVHTSVMFMPPPCPDFHGIIRFKTGCRPHGTIYNIEY